MIDRRGGHGSSKNQISTRGADKVGLVPIGTVVEGEIPFVAENQASKDLDPWELPGTPIDDVTCSDQHSAPTACSSSRPEKIIDKAITKITKVESTEVPTQYPSSSSEMITDDEAKEEEKIQYNIAELTIRGQRLAVACGAEGGLGSVSLKFPKNFNRDSLDTKVYDDDQLSHSAGLPGSEAVMILELKSIANVSLVGMPNAGKSTLLGAMSRAKLTVGHYAFTTLRPNLGKLEYHQAGLSDRPSLIVANEIVEEGTEGVHQEIKRRVQDVPIFPVCAIFGEGIEELKIGLRKLVSGEMTERLLIDKIMVD